MAAHTGDMTAITTVVEKAQAAFGGIDIVVNNAATNPHFGPILTAEEGHWDKILDVNVKGYFRDREGLCRKYAGPRRGQGDQHVFRGRAGAAADDGRVQCQQGGGNRC